MTDEVKHKHAFLSWHDFQTITQASKISHADRWARYKEHMRNCYLERGQPVPDKWF